MPRRAGRPAPAIGPGTAVTEYPEAVLVRVTGVAGILGDYARLPSTGRVGLTGHLINEETVAQRTINGSENTAIGTHGPRDRCRHEAVRHRVKAKINVGAGVRTQAVNEAQVVGRPKHRDGEAAQICVTQSSAQP